MSDRPDDPVTDGPGAPSSLKTLTTVVYALYALSLFAGVTAVVAIVLNYLKLDEVRGTWLESHFRWQMRTFWWGLLWTIIGTVTVVILVGWVVLGIVFVWLVYRIARGWLRLNDGQPIAT